MADEAITTTDTTNGWQIGNAALNEQYQNIIQNFTSGTPIQYAPVTMPEQTVQSISDMIASYLRPYTDNAISTRKEATIADRAKIDVDAASRGMGASTWTTDVKNRIQNAESADIAGIESEYASSLAQGVFDQYQNYLNNKLSLDQFNTSNQLNVDMFNSELATQNEQMAYERALQLYQLGRRGGSGSGNDGTTALSAEDIAWLRTNNPVLYNQLFGGLTVVDGTPKPVIGDSIGVDPIHSYYELY